jgi:hypothetical protein
VPDQASVWAPGASARPDMYYIVNTRSILYINYVNCGGVAQVARATVS